jgi:hypothetical protein
VGLAPIGPQKDRRRTVVERTRRRRTERAVRDAAVDASEIERKNSSDARADRRTSRAVELAFAGKTLWLQNQVMPVP